MTMLSVAMFAQVTTSSVGGRISDQEGPVPGAPVEAQHTLSGTRYYAVTDRNGSYRINGIMPGGPYTVTVGMLGYRSSSVENIYAPLGETVTVNVTLDVETIGLDAAVKVADGRESSMNVSRAGAGTSISRNAMDAMPSVDRSMNDIMRLTPQSSTNISGFSVGGGNYRSSYVTVDGASFNNAFGIGSNLPAGGSPISLDALEQMNVNITPFDVRMSGFTGGAINAVTRSGSNEWHAALYNYFTSEQLTGDFVGEDQVPLSKALNNTVGVSVGGPVIKDRLFFFVNAEYVPETTPGAEMVARTDASADFGGSTGVARPTVQFMDEVSSFLKDRYGYDPGRYQDYSVATPDWKIMARIDWNINSDHKLTARLSHTVNASSSEPSSSITPFSSSVYNRTYGRTSAYGMYFESSRYVQNQDFTAAAVELNSRFMEGRLTNVFRATYSRQYEDRDYYGDRFPTVDILSNEGTPGGADAVITSFGQDPFTYGNLRAVSTVVATDEVSYNIGMNNIVAGAQFEWNDVKNGYMQGGNGYYVYSSWDDFKNNAAPKAFAITFPNNDALKQVYPGFKYMQASLYAQDELHISDNFRLTAGLRLELPVYPTVENNNNAEFERLAENSVTMKGLRTDDMPRSRLGISPRAGFNWDILGNRDLILRGGTGIYTGRIPFVWIVTSVGNANTVQIQYIDQTGTQSMTPGFHTDVKDIVADMYSDQGGFTRQDSYAPTVATILDKNLKMPTVWKSSLALDAVLPGGIKATLEGIWNKDIYSVSLRKLGIVRTEEGVTLPGEPAARASWVSEGIRNSNLVVTDKTTGELVGQEVQPVYITNSDKNGYYWSLTAQLQKEFLSGLSLMAAYTYSNSKTVSDGIGDQVSSAYYNLTYGVNGSNVPELGYSSYVAPHRFIANISYRYRQGKRGVSTFGLFYEGYNHCFVGQYSCTRYSYVMNNVTGDSGANNLIYIPTSGELASMPFTSDENRADFEKFISEDRYLSRHRGEYSKRGGAVAPWQSRFNFRFTQDISFNVDRKTVHTVQIGLDINNIANLLNSGWGTSKWLNTDTILNYSNGKYTFIRPEWTSYNSTYSTWEMLLSLRYFF